MKRFLLIISIFTGLSAGFCDKANAQVYNNEWINYSRTYYKFKISSAATGIGVYRIQQPVLAANSLGTVPAEHFQLWRDGQEVPIYTSVQTGIMGTGDYIEIFFEPNNGKMDKALYRNPEHQLNDKYSFQTDTAFYYLTINPAGGNKRLVPTINNVAGNTLPPEPYFIHTQGLYYGQRLNPGYAAVVGEYVYSSSYDQ